jgi:integrase
VGLRWSDLDLPGGTLTVHRQVVSVAGGLIIGPPKSEAGRRTVALDQGTVELLRLRHRRDRIGHWASTDEDFDDTLVFRRSDGQVIHPAYVSRHFTTLVARHGLRPIRLHDLRHTSASIGLGRGEPAGGQPTPGPLLHHHHRGRLLPRLPRHRGGVRRASGHPHRRRHPGIQLDTSARTAPTVSGFLVPTAPTSTALRDPLGAFPCAKEKP